MEKRYQILIQQIQDSGKLTKEFFKKLRHRKKEELTTIFNEGYEKYCDTINCQLCENCCKTISPRLNTRDIERISKFLGMRKSAFIKKYLKEDEDQDLIYQTTPCPFWDKENSCSIYEVRPKDCKEYPHIDKEMTPLLLNLTRVNAAICPIVAATVIDLKAKKWQ